MAKVAFVQFELRTRIGVMMLSSALKKHGHETAVFTGYDDDIVKSIMEYRPSLVAVSSSTIEHLFGLDVAQKLKKAGNKAPIIMGGPHTTFYPEETLAQEGLDGLCIGEGDDLIVEVADRIDSNSGYSDLKNLWLREKGAIIKNDIRNLIEDLDRLPFPDRKIYFAKYASLRKSPTATFILGRGCPHACSFCFNHLMKRIYAGRGRFVRLPSVDYAIAEIKDVKDRYGFKWVQINDDTINVSRKWLEEFLRKYKKEINTPFICNIRVDNMDEDLADLFVYAGVNRINFGVETGNEDIRKNILSRDMTNEQLIKVGNMFKKRGVRVFTANMIGLPGETIDNAFETIKINRQISPELAAFDILQPFPKTDIYEYCQKKGIIKDGVTVNDFLGFNCGGWAANKRTGSVLKQDNARELVNLQKFTSLLVRHYWLAPIVRPLIKLKPNRFFDFINGYTQMGYKIKYATSIEEKWVHIRDLALILIRGKK